MTSYRTPQDFRFGFIAFSDTDSDPAIENWSRVRTGDLNVLVHPDCDVLKLTGKNFEDVLVLGDIFVAHGEGTLEKNLLEVLHGSYDSLDNLAGNFVLFCSSEGHTRCITDPMGSKPVFYSDFGGVAVASHSLLLAEYLNAERDSEVDEILKSPNFKRRTTTYLPGDVTPYKGIYHLIPNNELVLPEVRTKRYWPRKALEPQSFEDYIDVWSEYFSKYSEFLKGRYQAIVGLTPGVDTRALVASLRANNVGMDYVTWSPMQEVERVKVPELIDYLSPIRHTWLTHLTDADKQGSKAMSQHAADSTGNLKRGSTLAYRLGAVTDKKAVFIKGLGGEILRGSFGKKARPFLPDDPVKLIIRTYAGPSRAIIQGDNYIQFVRDAAIGYCERANFPINESFDHDPGDLLYWEGRMGTYGALGLLEISVGLAVHAGMNSRKLFEVSWGLPDSERLTKELLLRTASQFDYDFSRFEP